MAEKSRSKKPKAEKVKKTKEIPKYDYFNSHRSGSMVSLVEQTEKKGKRFLTLADWPVSLLQAHKAGVLTGQAERDAEQFARVRVTGHGTVHKPEHPWFRAVRNYRPISTVEAL
jgi:hypothetical protein